MSASILFLFLASFRNGGIDDGIVGHGGRDENRGGVMIRSTPLGQGIVQDTLETRIGNQSLNFHRFSPHVFIARSKKCVSVPPTKQSVRR